LAYGMGFKKTSDLVAISFGLPESGANTFTQEEIALQLDILNNEIFVCVSCDLDVVSPDAIAATDTATSASVTSTTQAAISNLSNTNCITTSSEDIRAAGLVDGGVGFTRAAESVPSAKLDYIALIATNNFFVQVQGTGNGVAKAVTGRLWGYRARADASTYAALVQSEVLSA